MHLFIANDKQNRIQLVRTTRLAEAVKCPFDKSDPEPMIQCLRQKNATLLVNQEWAGVTVGICEFPFVPIIDGSFLDETPQTALNAKNFKKTNILLGANRDEGFYFILYYLGRDSDLLPYHLQFNFSILAQSISNQKQMMHLKTFL